MDISTLKRFEDTCRQLTNRETVDVMISPEVCRDILIRFNVKNRRVRPHNVLAMTRILPAWLPVIIEMGLPNSGELFLLDGQHRLDASARSNTPLHEILRVSVGDEQCKHVAMYKDARTRSFTDRLVVQENLRAPAKVASVLTLLAQMVDGKMPCELLPDDEIKLKSRFLDSVLFAIARVESRQGQAALALAHKTHGERVRPADLHALLSEHTPVRGRGASVAANRLYADIVRRVEGANASVQPC